MERTDNLLANYRKFTSSQYKPTYKKVFGYFFLKKVTARRVGDPVLTTPLAIN
jgi:hypothetical protein